MQPLFDPDSRPRRSFRASADVAADRLRDDARRLALGDAHVTTPPRDCEHGQLARACERCDDARELVRLRAVERAARGLFAACDYVLADGWRAETLATGPGTDAVNWAWHALADALGMASGDA